ncbi:MAG TPA: enoyl-CoA hydratase/isomerase family protein, partial [Rhizobacter sp.]|nr:enoyl-CoA hydratase/isomerase family protein [Rhizobacter sp.]
MNVLSEIRGNLGVITLNKPQALNALSLAMVRDITTALLQWRDDAQVTAVLLRGAGREGKAPAFCAGGDIRFFHQAALAGDPTLEDFFTEEYTLNHLIHAYPKPYVVFLDGIVMGGGMGISAHGGDRSLR